MSLLFPKRRAPSVPIEALKALTRLTREYPPEGDRFLDSFPHFLRLIGAKGGALFLREPRASIHLLKTWAGTRPAKFSLSASSPFLSYLALQACPVSRGEFVDGSHELRQSALVFYQQVCADTALAVRTSDGEPVAVMTADGIEVAVGDAFGGAALEFYASLVACWMVCQELKESRRKLSEIGLVKNQLLANVTHELNTPLNGILGVAEAMLDGSDGILPPPLRTHLDMIRGSAKDLSATVENIVKLTRLEATRNEVPFTRARIRALAEEVIALYLPALREKGLRFTGPPAGQDYDVFVEPDQIRTVFMNLIGNAVKFTSEGEIIVTFAKNGSMLHACVSDTGIGIEEEKLGLIFEEFTQGDGGATRVYGGTGLGLAIVKKIVSLHGGRVWAESGKGRGSRFTFTLPLFPA